MTDPLTLAGGFPPATRDDWLAEVRRVILRGRPGSTDAEFDEAFVKQLVTRTEDGIEIQPLYTASDVTPMDLAPGQAPYIRSAHAAPVAWEIRQRVWSWIAESSAVQELESGATGVLLTMSDGVSLQRALEGVLLDLAPVSLSGATAQQAGVLLDIWESSGTGIDERRGCLGLDPLGDWARSGGSFDLGARVDALAGLVRRSSEVAPCARAILVDGTVWHDAGATDVQELAWSIAAGLWVVRELVSRGVDLRLAVRSIEFRLAATAEQFPTIAKMRAARWLWARALEVAGVGESERAMRLHAECSRVMLTRYDVWVNILRSTVATFSAAVGGADAITVLPHDVLLSEGGTRLGRRIARNTQSILQLESHLSRVIDPAGGSWFVESLTRDIAAHAWTSLQGTERDGGIVAMLEAGTIGAAVGDARNVRARALATRRRPITGVSEYPNIDEVPPPAESMPPIAGNTRFAPLTLHRYAQDFEEQRARADAMAVRPSIFLATLGSPAAFTARATYAKNFFEAAGIRTIVGSVAEFDADTTEFVCLCSADAVYAEQAAPAVQTLRAAGAQRILLAGRGAQVPGVDEEIGIGVDVLDVLARTLDEMGAPR